MKRRDFLKNLGVGSLIGATGLLAMGAKYDQRHRFLDQMVLRQFRSAYLRLDQGRLAREGATIVLEISTELLGEVIDCGFFTRHPQYEYSRYFRFKENLGLIRRRYGGGDLSSVA